MNDQQILKLKQFGKLNLQVPISSLTTIRVGGIADGVIYPKNVLALLETIQFCKNEAIDYFIFGNGSNILASDDAYHGLIIKLTRTLNNIYQNDHRIVVEAGYSLPSLAYYAMKQNLSGLQWAGGIPGTLGGAIFMNAGAYHSSISNVVSEVLVLKGSELEWMSNKACEFEYRKSIFQENRDWIIIAARLHLTQGDFKTIESIMNERRDRRLNTQPLSEYTFGSCFRNLDKPSWQYIDECGLRGHRIGDASVSSKHSNFIVNNENATFEDIINIIDLIKEKVRTQFGVDLVLEVESFNWKHH